MKRFTSLRKDKRKSVEKPLETTPEQAVVKPVEKPLEKPAEQSAAPATEMATQDAVPPRQETMSSIASDEAVPTDTSTTAGLLTERLAAWKHAVVYLEEYMEAAEKLHKIQAKEYEKVLKTISKPLREGQHFDQTLGGMAGFFENMRVNTEALVNSNLETEKNIKGSALPVVERLHKEIKHKAKELAHGAEKTAKEVEKARNNTQKHIELLGQNAAAFEATGGKAHPNDDPYIVQRGVLHRLSKQVIEENNQHNDLVAVQNNFEVFERHIVEVIQQAMETFTNLTGGQALKVQALHADILGAAQRIPPTFEWKAFLKRSSDALANPNQAPRTVEAINFPNMSHPSTKPLIEGSLERKSRNKLSWGYTSAYYVVTPSKFLHEFKDSDNVRRDPVPELSIYLPDAVLGAPHDGKFNVKGKDRSGHMGGKLAGTSELAFKAHSPAEAEKWFEVIRKVAGTTGPPMPSPGSETGNPVEASTSAAAAAAAVPVDEKPKPTVAVPASPVHAQQETGVITGGETVASPVATSAVSEKAQLAAADVKGSGDAAVASPTAAAAGKEEKV